MSLANSIESLRNHTPTLKKILYGVMALTILFDVLTPRHEAHFFGDSIPGFWSVFGLVSCVALIRIMKGLSHAWLMRREDYYE